MAKEGKKSMSAQHIHQSNADIMAPVEADNRPACSPYAEPSVVILSIGENQIKHFVPEPYLAQSQALTARISRPAFSHNSPSISLPELDASTGHTIVHYLSTGCYQTLKPLLPHQPSTCLEYERSCLVYCAAVLYGLGGLEILAKVEMAELEQGLYIFDILDAARIVFPKLPASKTWYLSHLKGLMQSAFQQDQSVFTEERFLRDLGKNSTFDKKLWKCTLDVYGDAMKGMAVDGDLSAPIQRHDTHQVMAPGNSTTWREPCSETTEIHKAPGIEHGMGPPTSLVLECESKPEPRLESEPEPVIIEEIRDPPTATEPGAAGENPFDGLESIKDKENAMESARGDDLSPPPPDPVRVTTEGLLEPPTVPESRTVANGDDHSGQFISAKDRRKAKKAARMQKIAVPLPEPEPEPPEPELPVPESEPEPEPEPEPEQEPEQEPAPETGSMVPEPTDDGCVQDEADDSNTDSTVDFVVLAGGKDVDEWVDTRSGKYEERSICPHRANHLLDLESLRHCEICREWVVKQALSLLDLGRT